MSKSVEITPILVPLPSTPCKDSKWTGPRELAISDAIVFICFYFSHLEYTIQRSTKPHARDKYLIPFDLFIYRFSILRKITKRMEAIAKEPATFKKSINGEDSLLVVRVSPIS
jgi:hypothetical protein